MFNKPLLADWNTFPLLKINHISFNQDQSLLILSTNSGYRIFDTDTYTLLSRVDEFQETLIGPISKAVPLYKSQIICFMPDAANSTYEQSQLIFWNDLDSKIAARLAFKDTITNFILTQHILYIHIKESLYIFEVATMEFCFKVTNVNLSESLIIASESNPVTLAYVRNIPEENSVVHLAGILIDNKQRKLTHGHHEYIETNFSSIGQLDLSPKGELLIVVSKHGNKIHLYSTYDFSLKYCFYLGNITTKLSGFSFDPKFKFFSFICDNDELYVYAIDYKYHQEKYLCECKKHNDNDVTSRRRSTNTFLGTISRFFNDGNEIFSQYCLQGNITNFSLSLFQAKHKNEMVLIGNDGFIQKMEYNRKKRDSVVLIKESLIIGKRKSYNDGNSDEDDELNSNQSTL